ncbi:hypothetical protein ABZ468_50095 [Streptomyces sp. NPDC005708]|uniref:hypothetical protein n=1 Tax=Streptomyces sp. NPDC005708 TaxID=3154564 RepID=UPI0033EE2581
MTELVERSGLPQHAPSGERRGFVPTRLGDRPPGAIDTGPPDEPHRPVELDTGLPQRHRIPPRMPRPSGWDGGVAADLQRVYIALNEATMTSLLLTPLVARVHTVVAGRRQAATQSSLI